MGEWEWRLFNPLPYAHEILVFHFHKNLTTPPHWPAIASHSSLLTCLFINLLLVWFSVDGVKPLYDLYTSKVRETAVTKRKEENWDKAQRVAAGEALKTSPINQNGNNPVQLDKLDKEESEAKLEALDLLEKKYKDWGPLIQYNLRSRILKYKESRLISVFIFLPFQLPTLPW